MPTHKFCVTAEGMSLDSIRCSRTRWRSAATAAQAKSITHTPEARRNPNFKDQGQIHLRREDVLHIPGLGFDGLVGYSPIAMAKNAIGIALATEEYGAAFFKNGARPGGVLEHPGVLKDPSKLRESWHAVYGGTMNTGRIAVLEEGVKYQQIAIPPEETQFLETRKFQIDEIARLYRVPPHMIGDLEKSSFNNIEQQSLEFVKYTLNPWVVRWEQSLQKALFTEAERRDYFIRFKVDGLLRGDYKSRMEGYAIGRQNGWLSANDIRSLEDMNPIESEEGGDLYLINGSMTKHQGCGAVRKQTGGQRQPIARRTECLHSWDVFAYDLLPVQLCPRGLLHGQVSRRRK